MDGCPHGIANLKSLPLLLARKLRGMEEPGPGLFSLSLDMPEMDDLWLPSALPGAWSWTRGDEGLSLLGWGEAVSAEWAHSAQMASWLSALPWRQDGQGGGQPLAFVGHGFDGARARAVIPSILLRRCHGQTSLVLSSDGGMPARARWINEFGEFLDRLELCSTTPLVPMESERQMEMPTPADFKARVQAATEAISRQLLRKIVLSRRVGLRRVRPFDPVRLAGTLCARYPGCAVLAVPFGRRMLLAASPERLVSRRGEHVECHALAGTAPHSAGDPALGRRLQASLKDRQEHAIVVDWVASALRPFCQELDVPSAPRLLPVGGLQHLLTPIRGRLRSQVRLLDLAGRLHPTPAVAGSPQPAALALLEQWGEERADWYSGAAGWVDRAGNGDLAVVLRCVMLDGHQAELSAGAGIVAASKPEAELAETELKLRAMLDSLRTA